MDNLSTTLLIGVVVMIVCGLVIAIGRGFRSTMGMSDTIGNRNAYDLRSESDMMDGDIND